MGVLSYSNMKLLCESHPPISRRPWGAAVPTASAQGGWRLVNSVLGQGVHGCGGWVMLPSGPSAPATGSL